MTKFRQILNTFPRLPAFRDTVAVVWKRRKWWGGGGGVVWSVLFYVWVGVAVSYGHLGSPAPSLLLRDRHGRFIAEVTEGDDEEFGYWSLDHVPERVAAATTAIEDRRFGHHPGVDPVSVVRALWQNVRHGERVSGASTIAMQIARMQRPGPRTYTRKATEAITALAITARYSEKEILLHYLRIAPYGNRIHGVEYAARRYFDKPVDDLSWAEVAFLTALPQAPGRMNPYDAMGRRRAVERGERILDLLRDEELITASDYTLAVAQIVDIQLPPRDRRPESAMHAVLRLTDLFADEDLRARLADRPIIQTTLDLELQEDAVWRAFLSVDAWSDRGAGNAAIIVLKRDTWEVLAYVGSTDYFDEATSGSIDYARVPRSPGSTLKPFFYAQALDRGVITSATVLDDLRRGPEGISNADDSFLGPLLPRIALANSRNVPVLHLLEEVGLDESYTLLGDLELHDHTVDASHYGLGLAIGAMPVTLEDLMRAYTTLAGDGTLHELTWYRGQTQPESRRILSEDSARQITQFLSDPMARLPSFPRMGSTEFPFAAAVKTGTSQNNRDAWTVAWSHDYLVGVWVGHPDYTPMHDLGGYRSAAVLAHHVLSSLHEGDDHLIATGFPPPRDHQAVRICALTGKIATSACDHVVLEWFAPGTEPIHSCDTHIQLAVDTRNGLLASSYTARENTDVRTFTQLAPQYASWAADRGLPPPPREVSPLRDSPVTVQDAPVLIRTHPPQLADIHDVPQIRIVSPADHTLLIRDPEVPPHLSTVALEAVVEGGAEQLVWYVDDQPYAVVDAPFKERWPLEPGRHTFQARVPYSDIASTEIEIQVQ